MSAEQESPQSTNQTAGGTEGQVAGGTGQSEGAKLNTTPELDALIRGTMPEHLTKSYGKNKKGG